MGNKTKLHYLARQPHDEANVPRYYPINSDGTLGDYAYTRHEVYLSLPDLYHWEPVYHHGSLAEALEIIAREKEATDEQR